MKLRKSEQKVEERTQEARVTMSLGNYGFIYYLFIF